MNKFLVLLLNILLVLNAQSQTKLGQYARMHKYAYDHLEELKHDYKHLKTIKIYGVELEYNYDGVTDKPLYLVNNKTVDKSVFEKFEKGTSVKGCTPCILETYDENDSLIRRAPTFMSTEFDWFKEYYPTGKIKQTGQFAKSIVTKDTPWLIYKKDGQWVKYDTNGDTLYSEFWQKGEFVKQVPEQKNTEIWKVNVLYKGNKLDSQLLTINDLKEIEIKPEFKNSNRDSLDVTVELFIGVLQRGGSTLGRTALKIHPDSLKTFDINKALFDMQVLSTDKLSGTLTVRTGTEGWLKYIPLLIKNDLPPTNDSLNKFKIDHREKKMYGREDHFYSFYLVNSADSTRKIRIRNNITYDLGFDDSITDTLIKYHRHIVHGNITEITDSTIEFSAMREEVNIEYKDSRTEYNYYSNDKRNDKSIPIQSLNYTDCKTGAKETASILGGALIVGSILTFIAAPLVSIDYIHGKFNSPRFTQIALAGGITLGVAIPLSIIGRTKHRKLTTKNAKHDPNYWYLEPRVKR